MTSSAESTRQLLIQGILGGKLVYILALLHPRKKSMNLKKKYPIVQGKQLRNVYHCTSGKVDMCQTDRHPCLYFYCMFCVNNTNIAFVQKYVQGVRGPLSSKRSSHVSVKVTKFAKRENL